MVQTSKTDHFLKLVPFWSPLTDSIDFGIAGKLLISNTRRCSPSVDSVSRIWIKPKKHWLAVGLQRLQPFGQSAPSRVQLTTIRNGHNRHFHRSSLVSSVCRTVCTRKIELYVSWAAYFRGVLSWLQPTAEKLAGFACTGTISRVSNRWALLSSSNLYFPKKKDKKTFERNDQRIETVCLSMQNSYWLAIIVVLALSKF